MSFQISGLPEADAVLDEHPFAPLVAMLLDQQYGMEHAFRGPWKIKTRLGSIDPAVIAEADPDQFIELATTPPAIHRYGRSMAGRVQSLAQHVVNEYDGDVTRIWTDATDGADLFKRLKALPGYGDQKAKIFVAFLAKQMNIRPDGWQEAAGDYALDGHRSVADVTSPETLQKVRDYKKAKKAAAKVAG